MKANKIHQLEDMLGVEPLSEAEIITRARQKDISILTERNLTTAFEGGWNAVHILADLGVTEVLSLPNILNISTKDGNNETVLHFLARKGCVDAVLQYSYPEAKNNAHGESPLHVLVVTKHLNRQQFSSEDLQKILQHKDVGIRPNKRGETVLHLLDYATEALQHPDVHMLKDSHGNLPLHKLARNGIDVRNHEVANTIKNNAGKTAADLYDGMTIKERFLKNQKEKAQNV